ncbi:hypothetical protein M9H77_06947 [Catharanthus roseus]|uniref:Uncharacterized protein n=1 Tax=Catharanthus roseus TaxID=4058 RepID=A0ACC0BTI4_CATRO|nr:hypothetical protein M9H77_06947 [Catharanthus roseus]
METNNKQEDYQSKLARDIDNFHHGGGNGFNTYGGNNHGNGNFIPRRHVGVGNFSSYAKSFEHTSYGDYAEFSKVNELPQAQEIDEESIVFHVVEGTSKEETCCIMSGKSIENKENERAEEKERLVEKLCIFDSISIFSKESEHLKCSKEKESEHEKSERVKENVCFIEEQENENEDQKEKEIVVFEKNEELNFYANKTDSFFASKFLCVQKFEDPSKDEGGKLAYKSIKTINFFPSNSYLSFDIYFKEIKLFSLVLMENGYQFYFLNSLGTLIEKKQFIEFNSNSCAIPRVDEGHLNIANYISYVLGIEEKGRNVEKELDNFLKDLPISLSLNPSLICYEVSLVGLEFFLESYLSHFLSVLKCIEKEEMIGDLKDTILVITMVAIAIGEMLIKIVCEKYEKDESSKEEENDLEKMRTKEMSEEKRENSKEELNVLEKVVDSFSSWAPVWGMIPNFLDSFVGKFLVKKVQGYLYSLIEDLLDKSIRRIVETYCYMISSFETFVITLKGISPFKIHFLNVEVQLESHCDDHKLLIGIEVLKAFLIETILDLQFHHLHFKESMFFLIFENKKKDGFGVLKVCHRVFVETILRKDFLELLLKNLVEKHLCYFKPFIEILCKDIFLDGLLVPNKNSFVISMKHEFSGTSLIFQKVLEEICTDSRTNPFKGGADGMTRDKQENMESFQGSVTNFKGPVIRSRARKIEKETQRHKFGRV